MAVMFPGSFPHDLSAKPKVLGEKLVYEALRRDLGETWPVFYDRPLQGTMRRVDFIVIDPARGAVAIEVKRGLMHAARGAFRQLIAVSGQRKRIDPFGQLKMAFARVCDARRGRYAGSASTSRDLAAADGAKCLDLAAVAAHLDARADRGGVHHAVEQTLSGRANATQALAMGELVEALKRHDHYEERGLDRANGT